MMVMNLMTNRKMWIESDNSILLLAISAVHEFIVIGLDDIYSDNRYIYDYVIQTHDEHQMCLLVPLVHHLMYYISLILVYLHSPNIHCIHLFFLPYVNLSVFRLYSALFQPNCSLM